MKKLIMALMLMPMMALATTWYVNGSSGADYNSGTSESTAKKTIQAAIDASSAGDTILVAPGTYGSIVSDNKDITIKSISGAVVTCIDGKGLSRCALLANGKDDRWGDDRWRTKLIGFTLRNGYIRDSQG